jgi:hypothetical protein
MRWAGRRQPELPLNVTAACEHKPQIRQQGVKHALVMANLVENFQGGPCRYAKAPKAFQCASFLMESRSAPGCIPGPAWTVAMASAQFGLGLGLYAPLKILLPLLADSAQAIAAMATRAFVLVAVTFAASPLALVMVFMATTLLGLGYGTYVATHQALVVENLPDSRHSARDLGLFNGANTAPMVLSPVVAWLCVMHLGGYTTLFGVPAFLTLASLLPLRGCRR